ncbi:DUF1707 domain-containing protein [Streptacidiphilus sp. N1-3]|uniref:DUF1707 domain-containing protein n=1 Tax=Streptacidiphilus alkalitolerans TaxID=3342712 RepID=A0ABV6X1Q9_9ACTN
MPADPTDPPALRASDADRDRVIDTLRTAVADGRLDPAEFHERLDAALTARTLAALTPLTADLVAEPGRAVALPHTAVPARLGEPAAELLTIKEKHGIVRREGDWTLPHRLALRVAWSQVTLDLSSAVYSRPELVVELRMSGGSVELLLAPGMVVDANELAVRHGQLEINRDPADDTPQTLRIRLTGRMKHGRIETRRLPPTRP